MSRGMVLCLFVSAGLLASCVVGLEPYEDGDPAAKVGGEQDGYVEGDGSAVFKALCDLPGGTYLIEPGDGGGETGSVSNVAYGVYYVDAVRTSGDFLVPGLDVFVWPGFTQGDSQGFVGTGANLFFTFSVPPTATGGSATVRARVFNTAGQTICQSYFDIEADVTNLALGASASASSTFCSSSGLHCYYPSRINDGSTDQTVGGYYSWANGSTSLPQWVQLDFGANRTFSQVELYTSEGYPIRNYRIQSWNGSGWVTKADITGNTSTHRTHSFSATTSSRIRVLGLAGPTNQPPYVRVNELEVYE